MQPAPLTGLRGRLNRLIENELIRRVVKNSSYLLSATGFSAALSMFQSMLAGKLLGAFGFGVLGVITQFTSMVNNLASFRMSELVVKYVGHFMETGDNQRAAAVFKAAALVEMAASLLAFGLAWLLAPLGAQYLAKNPALAELFVLYAFILLANLIAESSTGLLYIFDRFRPIAAINILQSLITLGIIAIVYIRLGNLYGVILAYLAGKVISAIGITIVALVEATRHWGSGWWSAPLGLLRPQRRELVHFAISTNLSGSLSLINKDSELLWISYFLSPLEAGYYKVALALANLVQLPVSPLPQATYPEISREVARQNWRNLRYVLRQGTFLAGSYSLAATAGLVLFGQVVITYLYRPEYLPAFPALVILLVGLLVANGLYWSRTALLALGRPDYPTRINFVLAIGKIAGIILLVPRFGYLASAALLSASYVIGVSLSAWKVNRLVAAREQAPVRVALSGTGKEE